MGGGAYQEVPDGPINYVLADRIMVSRLRDRPDSDPLGILVCLSVPGGRIGYLIDNRGMAVEFLSHLRMLTDATWP
jgi:hypothetical protein